MFSTLFTWTPIYLFTILGIWFSIFKSQEEWEKLFSIYEKLRDSPLMVASSRAIPIWLNKSGLWLIALLSTSIIESLFPIYSFILIPRGVSVGRIIIPSCLSSIRPNSSSLQIIPSDVSPLIFDFCITNHPHRSAHTIAKGTVIHTDTLEAPQTIWSVTSLYETLHILSFSLSGCFCTSTIFAVNTFERFSQLSSIPSTSAVCIVSSSAISWGLPRLGRYFFNTLYDTFIDLSLYREIMFLNLIEMG